MSGTLRHDSPKIFPAIILLTSFFATIIFLATFPKEGPWYSAVVFFVILSMVVVGVDKAMSRGLNYENVPTWSVKKGGTEKEALDKKDLLLIPVGFGVMILVAIFLTPYTGVYGPLVIGGLVLVGTLLRSQTVVIPWLIHGFYNISAFMLATFSIIPGFTLSSSPFFVPQFDFGGSGSDIIFQVLMQLFGVALMEEYLKVGVAIGLTLLFPIGRIGALMTSMIFWVLLHGLVSYRLPV